MWTSFTVFVAHAPLWFKIIGFALVWAKPVGVACVIIGTLFALTRLETGPTNWGEMIVSFVGGAISLYLYMLFWTLLVAGWFLGGLADFFRSPDDVEYERMLLGREY